MTVDIIKTRYFIKEVLDIRYLNENNEHQNKQVIMNTKIVPNNQYKNLDKLKQHLESEIFVIYDNKNYTSNHYETKYKTILESNINKGYLIYVTHYFYLDSYPNHLFENLK